MGNYAKRLHRKMASRAHNLPTAEPKRRPGELLPGVLVQRNLRMAHFFEFVMSFDVTLFSKDRIRIPWKASWPPTRHQQFGFPSRGSRAFVPRYSMSYH